MVGGRAPSHTDAGGSEQGARVSAISRVPSMTMTDQQITDTQTLDLTAEQARREAVLAEAVSVIDGALAQMMQRELVSSGEVADLLLDVRTLLTAKP